jgi:hypothetical protein
MLRHAATLLRAGRTAAKEKPPQGERGGFLVPGRAGGLNWPARLKLGSGLVARKGLFRNRSRPALLIYAKLAGVTRLPYGGALTLDALTQ